MVEPCVHNTYHEISGMPSFNLSSKVAISTLCFVAILLLALGGRAIKHSVKLPVPFKTLCMIVVGSDMMLGFVTGLQPWLHYLMAYEQELSTLFVLIVTMTTTLVSTERAYALKCPMRYIACSSNCRMATLISVSTFVTMILLYMFVRFLVCYMMRYTMQHEPCMPYQFYFATISESSLMILATICFFLVLHSIWKDRVQHQRRITRMGLPTNHASSATDTHISAILFILYPCMLCIAITSLLAPYVCSIEDLIVPIWISIVCRICFCFVHAVVFNAWFDEGRLHLLTLLSSVSKYSREWAEEMRINVYNIVIAQAFEGSRASLEGVGPARRISRIKNPRSTHRTAISTIPKLMNNVKEEQLEKNVETKT